MPFTLFPRQNAGSAMLVDMAGQLSVGVGILSELMGAREQDVPELVERLHETEVATSHLQYTLLTQMRSTFLATLPREDTYALSVYLVEIMADLDAAGDLIELHRLTHLSIRAQEQLEVVGQQVDLTITAMGRLTALDDLEDYWIAVHRLARRSEAIHRVWIAELIGSLKPASFNRYRTLADQLIGSSRRLRELASHMGRIIVRES